MPSINIKYLFESHYNLLQLHLWSICNVQRREKQQNQARGIRVFDLQLEQVLEQTGIEALQRYTRKPSLIFLVK